MFAGRFESAAVQQKDSVARLDRRQAVRQKDGCLARQLAGKGIVKQGLGIVVEVNRRLFDNVQGRLAQNRPRQGNAKLFADR